MSNAMTRDDLTKFVTGILKNQLGSEIATLVRDQMEKSLEPIRAKLGDGNGAPPSGVPVIVQQLATGATPTMPPIPVPRSPEERSLAVGRFARVLALHRGNVERAAAYASREWGDEAVAKAMSTADPTAGGFLVPEEFSRDVISLLRPAVVVRSMNPVVLPMTAATVRVPKITSGSTATYIGENTNITKSEVATGQLTLSFKKLAALVPLSNDLLRYSAPGADAIVRDDIVRSMAQRENQAFIRDNGTGGGPKGLRHWAVPSNVVGTAGTALANVTTDLGRGILKLMENNVPITRGGWIMAPRSWHHLTTVQNTNGFFVFRDEMLRGQLWGYPFGVTTQVPVNLTDGGGSTETELYFVDFADAVIGESQRLILDASADAAYHDGSNVVAAYSQDQTVIRAIAEHDFVMRRDVSVAVVNKITWGA